jgi:hypothetical protein
MFTDQDVEVVAGRLRTWGEVLGGLAEPDRCRSLLEVLDSGDVKGFHRLLDEWGFEGVHCIEIAERFSQLVHTGDYDLTRVCEFVQRIRPPNPSPTTGRGYRLADGRVLWLSEADWWDMVDHAVRDEAWRRANYDLLVAVGIMTCHFDLTPSVQRFDITKTYQICPPTGDPHERRG